MDGDNTQEHGPSAATPNMRKGDSPPPARSSPLVPRPHETVVLPPGGNPPPGRASPDPGPRRNGPIIIVIAIAVLLLVIGLLVGLLIGTRSDNLNPTSATVTPAVPVPPTSQSNQSSRSAVPTNALPPTAPPNAVTYSARYKPASLTVASGTCQFSGPMVDLSVPRTISSTSGAGFGDFSYGGCAGPSAINYSTSEVDGAVLPDGSTPSAESCNAAIESSLIASGEIVLKSDGGQVVCLRRTQDVMQDRGAARVLSAIQVTAVDTDSVKVTAYSWDIPE